MSSIDPEVTMHIGEARQKLIEVDEKANSLYSKIQDIEKTLERAIAQLWQAKRENNTKEQVQAHINDIIDIIARVRTDLQGDIHQRLML